MVLAPINHSQRILLEYETVTRRPKFSAIRRDADIVLKQIDSFAEKIIPLPLKVKIPDPGDLPFIEVALSAGAKAIITGNKRHFPLAICGGVMVWSPRELLDNLAEEI